jgi:hypothetical protein
MLNTGLDIGYIAVGAAWAMAGGALSRQLSAVAPGISISVRGTAPLFFLALSGAT